MDSDNFQNLNNDSGLNKNVDSALTPVQSRNQNLNTYISIIATVILLIVISVLMLQPPSMQRLARESYESPFTPSELSNFPAGDSLFQLALAACARRDWKTALSDFNQIDEKNPSHDRILYFMAHAFVGEGQYEQALALFKNPVFYQGQYRMQAEWYKALMDMLLHHPKDEILLELDHIAGDTHQFYSDQAKEILRRLKVRK